MGSICDRLYRFRPGRIRGRQVAAGLHPQQQLHPFCMVSAGTGTGLAGMAVVPIKNDFGITNPPETIIFQASSYFRSVLTTSFSSKTNTKPVMGLGAVGMKTATIGLDS